MSFNNILKAQSDKKIYRIFLVKKFSVFIAYFKDNLKHKLCLLGLELVYNQMQLYNYIIFYNYFSIYNYSLDNWRNTYNFLDFTNVK